MRIILLPNMYRLPQMYERRSIKIGGLDI